MTAIFTVVLGISTIGLWIATMWLSFLAKRQARDMRQSIVIAGRSAKAAKKSATIAEQSLLMAETPCLAPEVITECISIDENHRYVINRANATFTYKFRNFGRTPAFIRKIQSAIVPMDKMEPMFTDIWFHQDSQGADIVPSSGGVSIDYSYNTRISDMASFIEGRGDARKFAIVFFGKIYYDDVFGREYIKDFLMIRSETTGEFIPGAKEHNLTRRKDADTNQGDEK